MISRRFCGVGVALGMAALRRVSFVMKGGRVFKSVPPTGS